MNAAVRQAGFTLIEILVAMGILLMGMTGIFAVFAASLALQKEATERFDVSMQLSAVMAQVQGDLAASLDGKSAGDATRLSGQRFPVPDNPNYSYRVWLEPIPDDPSGRGWFCRIEIIAKSRGDERVYDMGYRPIIPEPDNDARIRKLLGQ
ncbi:MAG: hypothetical protein CMJ83_13460 [Planctomycetes bacterium]|nr:hypothetical protein [Planctomycetota bacterium]